MYALFSEGRTMNSESGGQSEKLKKCKQKRIKLGKLLNAKELEDGLVYIGEMQNGDRNGLGMLIYPNGSILEGQSLFQNIKEIGQMEERMAYVVQYSLDEYYEGNIVNDRFQGYGEYVNKNYSVYKGQWENNERHGYGEEYFKSGSIYCGNFSRGMRDGKGVYLSSNGSKYQGEFKCNQMDGDGMMFWIDGSFYEGQFSNNDINGYGIYTYPDGSYYKGNFLDGKRNGHGSLIRYDGYEVSGEWESEKFYRN